MEKANLIIKIVLCVLCAIMIITVFTIQFVIDISSTGVRTEKDLQKIVAFIIASSVMLVIVVALGIILLVPNKKRNELLIKLVDESESFDVE